jgi:hypothetical protein
LGRRVSQRRAATQEFALLLVIVYSRLPPARGDAPQFQELYGVVVSKDVMPSRLLAVTMLQMKGYHGILQTE